MLCSASPRQRMTVSASWFVRSGRVWLLIRSGLVCLVWFGFGFGSGLVWFGLVWLGLVWLRVVSFRFGLVRFDLVSFGLAWLGLAWLGLAWLGLAWFRLTWSGFATSGCKAVSPAIFFYYKIRGIALSFYSRRDEASAQASVQRCFKKGSTNADPYNERGS